MLTEYKSFSFSFRFFNLFRGLLSSLILFTHKTSAKFIACLYLFQRNIKHYNGYLFSSHISSFSISVRNLQTQSRIVFLSVLLQIKKKEYHFDIKSNNLNMYVFRSFTIYRFNANICSKLEQFLKKVYTFESNYSSVEIYPY